jgi:hypothetical protein
VSGEPVKVFLCQTLAEARDAGNAGGGRQTTAGLLEAIQMSVGVPGKQPRSQVDRSCLVNLASVADGELRRSSANIDVEQRRFAAPGEFDCAGAVRRQEGFQIRPGRRTDELADLL